MPSVGLEVTFSIYWVHSVHSFTKSNIFKECDRTRFDLLLCHQGLLPIAGKSSKQKGGMPIVGMERFIKQNYLFSGLEPKHCLRM